MSKKSVFLTRKIPQKAIDYIVSHGIDLEMNQDDRVLTKEEIMYGVKGKDALICLLTDTIDSEIMEFAGKRLKIIANYAVGYNNIDIKSATERKIPVTNTPGVLTETTADLTMALLLGISRRIVESDKFTRDGRFKGWGPLLHLGGDIYGKTLGIIGAGRIGSAVAQRAARGFNMKILYNNRNRNMDFERNYNAKYVSLEELLKNSDFVTLHVPLTDETKYLIGEKEIGLMKETAYLINTSRGPVINEKALLNCLLEKKIAGAALDVYEHEPELTPGLINLDNIIITAHIGTATIDTRTKMGMIVAENLLAIFDGRIPPNCVNTEVFKIE
ncbi:MAG: D-glycerate dehydrogenase [Candidatus Heimdallarchaeota archaeon]|nr:D-glycerate dehydrogenase [Candidatus Heimdallarchaeota archaeon]